MGKESHYKPCKCFKGILRFLLVSKLDKCKTAVASVKLLRNSSTFQFSKSSECEFFLINIKFKYYSIKILYQKKIINFINSKKIYIYINSD
jgi:hypothetical protein